MNLDEFSKQLIESAVTKLQDNFSSSELMPEELVGTTYEVVMEDGETIIIEKVKMDGKDDNGFKSCWKGYRKVGTKVKGGKEVNDCKKEEWEKEEKGEKKHKEGKAEEKKELKKEARDMPGNQEKIDANKNGKVDAHDFALLRARKGKKSVKEMWEKAAEVAEGKKVEIEVMPEVETQNDPEPVTGKKAKKEVKKEEFEPLEEKKLSKAETAKKEKFVKGMKKKFGSFKSKYGEKAKDVMYGTATAMAKKAAK